MGHQLGTLKSSRASGGGWRRGKSEPMNTVAEGTVMRKLSLKEEGFDHITTPTLPQSSHATFPWWELLHSPLFQSLLILILNCCCCSIAKLSHGLQHSRLPCPSLSHGVCSNHVHWISDAIQPSYPLSSPSPPALNLSQHQGLFQSQFFISGGQTIEVSDSASVLPVTIQDWSPLGRTGRISLQSKGLSRVFSNTTVQKHQLFGAQLPL